MSFSSSSTASSSFITSIAASSVLISSSSEHDKNKKEGDDAAWTIFVCILGGAIALAILWSLACYIYNLVTRTLPEKWRARKARSMERKRRRKEKKERARSERMRRGDGDVEMGRLGIAAVQRAHVVDQGDGGVEIVYGSGGQRGEDESLPTYAEAVYKSGMRG